MAGTGAAPTANVVTSGPPYRTILKLAMPTVVAMVSQSLVNFVDTLFCGRLPNSADAQAALFPSLVLLWLFGGSLSAISVGTLAITARRYAEGKDEDVGKALYNAVLFSFVAGLAFTVIGYVTLDPLLKVLIAGDNNAGARAAAREYMYYRLAGISSMALTAAFKAFFDGLGKTYVHFVSAVVMNIINISACFLFIFGNQTLGLPAMGIGGAGLGAVTSTWIGLGVMIAFCFLGPYSKRYRPFRLSNWDWPVLSRILKLSIPGAVATIAMMTGFFFFAKVAGSLDAPGAKVILTKEGKEETISLAATNNIISVLQPTFTACLGFGTAAATLVSQCLGEKNPERAAKFGWSSVRLGWIVFGLLGLVEFIFAPQILHLITNDVDVQAASLVPMRMMAATTPVIATAMILTQALFGAGNTKFVMVVELLLHFLCLIPLAWVLGVVLKLGLVGLWSAAITYIGLLAIAMSVKFWMGGWKQTKL